MTLRSHPAGRSRTRIAATLVPLSAALAALGLVAATPAPATASPPVNASPPTNASPSAAPKVVAAWTVYHGDAVGSGDYTHPIALGNAHVAWTSPTLTGELYGEPLTVGKTVYVATTADVVYALDARSGRIKWSKRVATPVDARTLPCGDVTPTVGIVGTPVIDPARHELFAVADEAIHGTPSHHLVGLEISTGKTLLDQRVDPPGSDPSALLQRTGLNLSHGRVVFGFGGNSGDCSTYHGWVLAVPEVGGASDRFEVDASPGDREGAIWMGGGAPVVGAVGDVWVASGNGSTTSGKPDGSDSVIELTPSMTRIQAFTPSSWGSDNANDADLGSASPVLVGDGHVVQAGKSRTAYLLDKSHLGGIGGQQAARPSICGADVDGGSAFAGSTVYLPCRSGTVALHAASVSGFGVAWSASVPNAGPPIVAGGYVWTIDGSGHLDGLDPSTGAVAQQLTLGSNANSFPTPAIGNGLLLAPTTSDVVAFAGS